MKIKKLKPMFTGIVTTMDKYHYDDKVKGIITSSKMEGAIKEIQTVIAVGSHVNTVKAGDLVLLDFTRYGRKKHQEGSLKDGIITDNPIVEYQIPSIVINDKECLTLQDRDVAFIIEEWEEEQESDIVIPEKQIIS